MPSIPPVAFEVPLAHHCELGEGPVWDSRAQCLLWVDILKGQLHQYHPESGEHQSLETGSLLGAIALCESGQLLAALDTRMAFIERSTGKQQPVLQLEGRGPELRFNDGKCDPAGRFWAGTMPLSENQPIGNLYCVGKDLTASVRVPGVTISNGLAWDGDGTTLYYIDTPTRAVQAFDFNREDGTLSNRRIAFGIPESEGFPDGMTIDSEDKLWIAHWGGSQVARWDPDSGKKLLGLSLPAAHITSCTFGGPGLGDLYVTSARKGLDSEALANQPLAGSLFVFRNCGFRGRETDRFAYAPKTDAS
ncbi:SMP-30/gluconolactonase/LRE family protein [Robiginitalea sp. SC105]|uniref:SMP-30/gluconolactonase/LRE family protein n=1 Tax=Robiginitalea sp. SC105 TaxID=2762332 RepID=UPI00163A0D68|nr:SMP-30/gluconolactonase/LRE family protein [Robiginitalea sp. SC105]MBC2839310.1 SMP-30/gluconolactonase/LRE family protein [Robiginitalea sp. SC105]